MTSFFLDNDTDDFGAAPVQVEGELEDGRRFYFRARHRGMRLELAAGPGPHDFGKAEGHTIVALELRGWEHDRHPLSYFSPKHVRPLVAFLIDLAEDLEGHKERPPYAGSWEKTGRTPGATT